MKDRVSPRATCTTDPQRLRFPKPLRAGSRRETGDSVPFVVVRAKGNLASRRRASRPVDKATGLRCDQTILLTGPKTWKAYPDPLRRISYVDPETGKRFVFLTNTFTLPALTIAQLYKCRWRVERFFKWIKQYLRIKAFYGTSEKAVKTQNIDRLIWMLSSTLPLRGSALSEPFQIAALRPAPFGQSKRGCQEAAVVVPCLAGAKRHV